MAKNPNDDLFEGTTMTFGEHLEELRVSLFRGVMGVLAGCLIGFFVANSVVRFFQGPLERAMERYYLDKALSDLVVKFGSIPVEIKRMILDDGLVPDPIQIETGQLAETLRLNYPEQFAALNLSPSWYTEGDFLDGGAPSLAQALVKAADAGGSPQARCVWLALTDQEREKVAALAKIPTPLDRQQTADLLHVLNSLASRRELHAAPELAALTGPDTDRSVAAHSTVAWLQSAFSWLVGTASGDKQDTVATLREELAKKFDPEKSRRLNKLLIARVFPDSLKKARVNLLTLFTWKPVKVRFQVLNAQEAFMIWLKAALMTGLVLASPYVLYQLWVFVAAGLYPHEKNYVFIYLPLSIGLFFGGALIAFLFVFDPVLDFLFTFNKGMNADFDPRIGEWLGFVLILPIGFGLGFQLPLVMLFVNRIGLVSTETYVAQWRIAVLTIFVIAMVLTPAEPISMLLMAGPLCLLYVMGIAMCKFMPRGRNPFAEAYEP
ncbi:MAG: twin-arginine translocase subunit TatC [Planctomycetaceae bacterium]|nr:twin-arginine translocase subunit TatC [Planctomycetaceae bacterium]